LDNPDSIPPSEKQTLSENLIECLYDISQKGPVLATLAMHSLENFIRVMLVSLISPSVRRSFSNRKSLIARLNDITLGVLQNCDRTMAFYILISFLKAAEPEEVDQPIESTSNFSNVVVKCLAKLMILIPKVIQTMKVDQILQVIHQFFTLKPPKVWNRPGCNNKPYRVARTCLSKFVEHKGPAILQDLRKVVGDNPNPKPVIQLFTEQFIEKKFPNYQNHIPTTTRTGSMTDLVGIGRMSSGSFSAQPGLSSAALTTQRSPSGDELSNIINSINSTSGGYSDPGLQRLYNYLQVNPNVDLDGAMFDKTDIFKGYVKRGLEQFKEQNINNRRFNRTPSTSSMTSNGSTKMSTDDLRERLNALRSSSMARNRKRDNSISIDNIRDRLAKFQTNTGRESVNSTATGTYSNLPSTQSSASVLSEVSERRTSTTLQDLRQRLNKIKQQGPS